jgi:hypothetical protein
MKTLEMMFGGGANVAQLADMIRRFGRGEDKILAHITPEEAAMLKEAGGSGEINPMTGLPEFQEYEEQPMQQPDTDYRAQLLAAEDPGYYGTSQTGYNQALERQDAGVSDDQLSNRERYDLQFGPKAPMFEYTGNVGGLADRLEPFTQAGFDRLELDQRSYLPPDALEEISLADQQRSEPSPFGRDVQATDENIFRRGERGLEELNALINRYPNLSRIGGAGANVLGQALIARRANRQREAQAAAERARAVPFRQAEAEAMARARGGGLTPQNARRLEAQQARARQGLGAGNQGAGSAAAGILAGQEQRTRSLARQESFDEALKQAGIADQYERRAIAAELAADKEMADIFSRVLGNEISAATRTQAAPRRP